MSVPTRGRVSKRQGASEGGERAPTDEAPTWQPTGGTTAPTLPGEGSRLRLVVAAALLFGEYLVVSTWVDAATAAGRGGLWRVLAHLGAVGPVMVTTAAAWFIICRLRPIATSEARAAPSSVAEHPSRGDPRPVARLPWLLLHLPSFAALLWASNAMFGASRAPDGPAVAWFLAWCVLAVLVFGSALLGTLGGARWLRVLPEDLKVAAPVGLLAWLGGLASAATWQYSSGLTLQPAAWLLSRGLALPSVAPPDAQLLHIDRLVLDVSSGCGGHEGFGVFIVLMAAYLYGSRKSLRFPSAGLALPVGLCLVWLANVVRFAVLGYLGVLFEPRVAVASFHSKATWVLFCALAVACAATVRRSCVRRAVG